MSDNLQIPSNYDPASVSSGYRARRASPEPGMRMMTIAAAGLGGALVLGMGVWGLMGRQPTTVPVIEADGRPLRVKPDNPGGMQVAGGDEAVLGGQVGGVERVAPAAEAPAPQALRAQAPKAVETTSAAAPNASPAVPQPERVVATASPAPSVSPLPDTPPPAPPRIAAPAATAATPAPAARPAATGGAVVQLAAVQSEAVAQAEWQRLSKRLPVLLEDRRLILQRAENKGREFWRIRTGGFADAAEAASFCAKIKAKGGNCAVASF